MPKQTPELPDEQIKAAHNNVKDFSCKWPIAKAIAKAQRKHTMDTIQGIGKSGVGDEWGLGWDNCYETILEALGVKE